MKYDKDTMNSLQEAYASVNEEKYYKGDDRNPNTGFPKGIRSEKAKQVKQKRAKRPNYEGSTAGSDLKDIPEEQDLTGITLKQKKQLERQKQLAKKQQEAPVVKNKIVPMKTRTEEAIKMSRKEYNKTHTDFKSDDKKNPRVTRYVPGKGTVSTPVEIIDEGNKENCGCGQTPCKTYGNMNEKKKEMDDKMKEVEDMRSLPTRMNLIKTKLRAMGLNMSHQLKGKELSEVIDYALDEATRYKKEMGYNKGGTKKPTSPKTPDPALDAVKAKFKGQIMRSGSNQPKKVKGEKSTMGTGKYKAMADQKKETAADAKKRGFDNVQNYVDTMARYGGKKNYDSGKGLGS